MGGQLRWALCLSGNPPDCVVADSFHSCIVESWRINLSLFNLSCIAPCGPFVDYSELVVVVLVVVERTD